jgi:hypothetical protein
MLGWLLESMLGFVPQPNLLRRFTFKALVQNDGEEELLSLDTAAHIKYLIRKLLFEDRP